MTIRRAACARPDPCRGPSSRSCTAWLLIGEPPRGTAAFEGRRRPLGGGTATSAAAGRSASWASFALGGLALAGAVAHRNPAKARAAETTSALASELQSFNSSPDAAILDGGGLPDGGAVEPPTPMLETKARNLR